MFCFEITYLHRCISVQNHKYIFLRLIKKFFEELFFLLLIMKKLEKTQKIKKCKIHL